MRLALLLICAASWFTQTVIAQTPQWQVKPSVCISDMVGDSCELALEIDLTNVPAGRYCLMLDDSVLRCALATDFAQKIAVTLTQNSQLTLVNGQQQTLLSHPLEIKSRQATLQRRRLRNPWSLF